MKIFKIESKLQKFVRAATHGGRGCTLVVGVIVVRETSGVEILAVDRDALDVLPFLLLVVVHGGERLVTNSTFLNGEKVLD